MKRSGISIVTLLLLLAVQLAPLNLFAYAQSSSSSSAPAISFSPTPSPAVTASATPSPTALPAKTQLQPLLPSVVPTPHQKHTLQTSPVLNTATTTTQSGTLLGGMDLNGWCASINEGQAALQNNTTWVCTGNNQPINFATQPTPNCVWQYNISNAFAVQTQSGNPYSWACYASQSTATPTPTPALTAAPTPTLAPSPTPTGTLPTPTPASNATDDWPTYKYSAKRSSYNPDETIINANSAVNLNQKLNLPCTTAPCSFTSSTPGAVISDAPAVVNNVMYYGDWTGNFYAKKVSDGSTIWSRNLGTMTPPSASACNPPGVGVVSSPSVRNVSVNGVSTPIVFIAGADGNMYALYAANGNVLWKTPLAAPSKGELLWDSPSEANGVVYIGVASLGDCPLVQGRIYKLGWRYGDIQAIAKLVPDGCVGAGSWGSPTFDQGNNKLYISTGTQDNSCKVNGQPYVEPYALAVVELDGTSLSILGSFRIPANEQGPDSDFGVSPALATATINGVSTQLVEAANKNGHMYIFKRDALSSGPLEDITLAPGGGGTCPDCSMGTISTAATDGTTLYQGMGMCNINLTSNCAAAGYNSYMFAINPKDGSVKWKALIPKQIVSTPILLKDSLVVFEGNSVMILRTSDGSLIKQITPAGAGSILDGSGAVARGQLFFGNLNGNFYEFGI